VSEMNEFIKVRLEKLKTLREKGVNPYPTGFAQTHHSSEIVEKHKDLASGDHVEADKVAVAGRLMTIRDMGKSCFAHLQDAKGKVQIYVKKDVLGEEAYGIFKLMELGDIIGVKGFPFKTKTG
jgi:lysyl-tRNA synthetase class 2